MSGGGRKREGGRRGDGGYDGGRGSGIAIYVCSSILPVFNFRLYLRFHVDFHVDFPDGEGVKRGKGCGREGGGLYVLQYIPRQILLCVVMGGRERERRGGEDYGRI